MKSKSPPEESKLTPMLKQYLEVKKSHPDKLILFRMGDFYETFFEDAHQAARVLNITLTTRNKNDANPVPLAGFPYHALDIYLDKLIKSGLKVAICEQVEDPKQAVGLVKREVTEIITPGAILDHSLISSSADNYLTALYWEDTNKKIGIASLDISTGSFTATELTSDDLRNELARLLPAELIVNSSMSEQWIKHHLPENKPTVTIFDSWQYQTQEALRTLKRHFKVTSLECFGVHDKRLAATAAGAALSYVQSLYKDEFSHINSMSYYSLSSFMQLDEISRRNLELTKSIRFGNRYGSLISVLDDTLTPMGSRLIMKWLLHPLMDMTMILSRQQMIKALIRNTAYLKDLRVILRDIGDVNRIGSRLGANRINPREILALRSYVAVCSDLVGVLNNYAEPLFDRWIDELSGFDDLVTQIDHAICEKPPITITDGGIFKGGYHSDLDDLIQIIHDGKNWIARLEDDERKKTGITSLKVGYNKVFGYYIEVTLTHKNKVPDYYTPKQTLVNSERYITPRLKEFEAKVLSAEERIKNLEYELYRQFRTDLINHLPRLQILSDTLAEIDTFANLALIAWQNNYCCPLFTSEQHLIITEGRHPVIEKLLENEEFIPNDTELHYPETNIAVITGPNMAGKSTYLRQIGLLVIMAQMGSFVPAKQLYMPIFDRVFTRVGASDNLAHGQSTFLVEMIETANILHNATTSSLILLDEIGRGTSTFDGLSLAWAIIEHIQKHTKTLTLFATHYHELTELENIYSDIKNYNVAVKEWNDEMIFLRKIERGGADQSYGIQVARLAGIPQRIIKRAKEILHNLEEHELSPQGLTAQIKKRLNRQSPQTEIFEVLLDKVDQKDEIITLIRDLDLDKMTPIEAWQKLMEIQNKSLELP